MQDFLQYTNHLGLCTEEISDAGEACVFYYCLICVALTRSCCVSAWAMPSKVSRAYSCLAHCPYVVLMSFPAFRHVTLISAAYNLSRMRAKYVL